MTQTWNERRRRRLAQQRRPIRRRPDERDDHEREDDEQPRRREPRRMLFRYDRVPLCLIGFCILGLWWAVGGRYTIDGMPLLGNAILDFFHAPPLFGVVTDPSWYLKLAWLPLAISIVERRNRPRFRMDWNTMIVYAMLIWLIVTGADFGSTYLAVTHPGKNAWTLAKQVAQIPILATLWTTATTFGPEIGFAALWKYMRG